jgi:hypothetical protein
MFQSITSTDCAAKATQPFNDFEMRLTAESSSARTDGSGLTATPKGPHGPAEAVALTQASGHKTTFEAELSALEQNAPKKGDA